MLEEFLERLAADKRSQDNPLVPHLSPFAASLAEDGYADVTTQAKLSLLSDFGEWLARRELSVMVLDEQLVERFINNRRQKGRLQRGDGETLRQFLKHLRGCHIAPEPQPIRDGSPLAEILNRYEKHLRSERGVVTSTVVNYLPFARKFLVERFAEGPLLLSEVTSSDVSAFVLRHAETMRSRRLQLMATAFRSFFRFLFQNGELQANLAAAVPAIADWRLSTVPKYLVPKEVDRVLAGCDRQTSTGRRDYAILLLLARLGLRAGEVVALQLDDIDWRAGEILVRGKGLLHDRMPLPVDVGEALTSYLRTASSMQNEAGVCVHEGAALWLCWTLDIDNDRSPRARSSGFTSGNEGSPRAETQSRHDDASFWREHDRNRRDPSTSNPQHNGNLCQARLRWSPFIGPPVAKRGGRTMNSLDQALNEYIAIRRALGFELREVAGCLRNFITFLKTEGASYITKELALRWAIQPAEAQPYTWAWRLGMVRRCAAWHSATEPRTEIPAPGLLPHRYQRKTPHIYSDEEIASLLRRAAQLPSSKGLRASTYTTLFGTLTVTGMRVNEALHLDRPDVDLDQGILTIRRTKFGKSRHVPVHPSTVDALRKYAETRDRILAKPTPAFFVSERGTRITEWIARYTFARLSQQLGLRSIAKGHGRGPRLHDMRHRFAARTLIHWYRAGLDVERELPKLATYLGHVHVNETYWYLEAVPELLQLATDRLLNNEKEDRS